MTTDVNDFLAGLGVKSARFPKIGTTVKGKVVSAEVRDQTDFETGEPLTWPNGDPRKQLVVTIQTDEREDESDDGLRRAYVRGQMLYALREALNGQELRSGGKLAIRYIADGEPARKGFNPPKQYKCWYEAPAQSASLDESGLDYDEPLEEEIDPAELPF